MLTLLKLLQSIVRALHSEGTPGQAASGRRAPGSGSRRMVRAKVDGLVAAKVEPVKRRIADLRTEAEQRLAAEQERLTGGLAPDITLPKIKL